MEWRIREQGDTGGQAIQPGPIINEKADGFQRVATRHTIRTSMGRNAGQMGEESRANSFSTLVRRRHGIDGETRRGGSTHNP